MGQVSREASQERCPAWPFVWVLTYSYGYPEDGYHGVCGVFERLDDVFERVRQADGRRKNVMAWWDADDRTARFITPAALGPYDKTWFKATLERIGAMR